MTIAREPLVEILQAQRLTAVVDIGANPLNSDGEAPYMRMLAKRLCTVVGFEPQAAALDKLNARKSDLETYLPYAVGDGAKATFKMCRAPGMSSLFTPEPRVLNCFRGFVEYGTVIEEIAVETRTLDSIAEIPVLDHLKIDVQGAELAVFEHARARLAEAVAIQTEVSFVALYKNQPVMGDIDLALRAQGFIPHMFVDINKRMILPLQYDDRPYGSLNQILEADIVYVRDFTQTGRMNPEQLKHLALIAHYCYASYDLAARCVQDLEARGSIAPGAVGRYLKALTGR